MGISDWDVSKVGHVSNLLRWYSRDVPSDVRNVRTFVAFGDDGANAAEDCMKSKIYDFVVRTRTFLTV